MNGGYHIVVCGSVVPDPLQTLAPIEGPTGPALKNELMLPAVLDPWAGHALYEAAHLAKSAPGSRVWLVSLGPKAKLQQLMMNIAQKVSFELVVLDGPAGGFEHGQAITGTAPGSHTIEKLVASRSRTNTSANPLVSPGTRLPATLVNAIHRPSGVIADWAL